MINKLKHPIIIWIICIVILFSIFRAYANLHVHIVNEQIIVHSHPVSKQNESNKDAPFKSHEHSSIEFLVYFFISAIKFIFIFYFLFNFFARLLLFIIILKKSYLPSPVRFHIPILRAPPSF